MKKKTAFLSLISALAIGAGMTFTACGDGEVAEHDHVYDNGTVTTESTCYKEGVRTYHCTVEGCGQTKTAPIAMIAHKWNDGEVTKEATCSAEGKKTYTCTVDGCGKTKSEDLDKADHSFDGGTVTKTPDFLTKGIKTFTCDNCETEKTESVAAHADFFEQFYTAASDKNNWSYGTANSYDPTAGTVDFVGIEQAQDGKWKTEKVEISKGHVNTESVAVIAYNFSQDLPKAVQTDVAVSFVGESNTSLKAYLIINNTSIELNHKNLKDWSYETENAIDIVKGDTLYLVLENSGEGKAGGDLSFTLSAPCVHVWDDGKVTEKATCIAEGKKEYGCASCDKKFTEKLEMVDHSLNDGDVTLEATETYAGIKTYSCTVEGCDYTETEVLPKIGKGADFRHEFTSGNQDGAWSYGHSDYSWDGGESFTYTAFENFAEGDGAWKSDVNGSAQIKNDWLDVGWGDGVKNATIAYTSEYAMTAKYTISFTGGMPNTRVIARVGVKDKTGKLKGVPVGHWTGKDNKDWEIDATVELDEGDTIYFIFFDEHGDLPEGWANGNVEIVINEVKTVNEFKGANFFEDFSTNGNNGWVYGYATDYNWDNNNFTFNSLDKLNDDAWGGKSGLEIKKDWILVEGGDVAVGYTVHAGETKLNVAVDFVGTNADETRIAARIIVVGADGNTKSAVFKDDGQTNASWQATQEVEVADGDTIYVVLFREPDTGWGQGKLQVTIEKAE